MRTDPFETIRKSRDDGQPLPGFAYRDDDVFAVESATLFRDGWSSVTCGQNVAERGDLFPVRIAGQSLLVLRDYEDEIRVFYNLCRHRGAPLADVQCRARSGRIVCPYHAWSYGLDGNLLAAPHFHRDESCEASIDERTGLGLLPVRTAVWRDIVFVNLSECAPPFEEFIRPLDERLAHWTAAELRPLSSDEYDIQANWKLVVENFLDVYHLPVVHPELVGRFEGILDAVDVEVSDDIMGTVLPDLYGQAAGQAESPLPRFSGLAPDEKLRIEVFAVFPNTLILVEPEVQQVIVLRPQAPGVTHETFANYLVSDRSQTDDLAKEREETYRSSVLINDQDAALLALLQPTRSMALGGHTHLTRAWDETIRRFQRLWTDRLLAAADR